MFIIFTKKIILYFINKLDLSDFYSDKAKEKYACANMAISNSKNCPEELYPDFNFF